MSLFAPFTLHLRVVPTKGKRFEQIRDLQRISVNAFEALDVISGINISQPGGGQAEQTGRISDLNYGLAVKPQFGNTPAQLMCEGFIDVDDLNVPVAADTMLIHGQPSATQWPRQTGGQESLSGPKGQQAHLGSSGNPISAIDAEVLSLRTSIDAALTSVVDSTGAAVTVFRLQYRGIIYGDRGHTFPR